jgi:hypothetical protein
MVRDVDLSTASQRIDSCIDATNDTLRQTEQNDNGVTNAWVVERGEYVYSVEHQDGFNYFLINFAYQIPTTIAQIIDQQDAERILSASDADAPDDDQERLHLAAQILLNDTPDDIQQRFANELIQLMSHPGVAFGLKTTDSGAVIGFDLMEYIYPFSDEFRFSEFNEAVQTVTTVGNAAMTYVQMSLDIQSAIDAQTPDGPVPYIR